MLWWSLPPARPPGWGAFAQNFPSCVTASVVGLFSPLLHAWRVWELTFPQSHLATLLAVILLCFGEGEPLGGWCRRPGCGRKAAAPPLPRRVQRPPSLTLLTDEGRSQSSPDARAPSSAPSGHSGTASPLSDPGFRPTWLLVPSPSGPSIS